MTQDLAQTLAGAASRRAGPSFYMDANILVDIVQPRRHVPSRDFVEECLRHSWRCETSTFALMEALDVAQENRWAGIEMRKGESFDQLVRRRRDRPLRPRIFREVHRDLTHKLDGIVKLFQPQPRVWEDAVRIAIHTSSFAPDCLHVAAARSRRCDILVTRDSQLRRTAAGEIEVATPEEVLSWLQTVDV